VKAITVSGYDEVYRQSIEDPETFWGHAAEEIVWEKRWNKVLGNSHGPCSTWFEGAILNTCYNCLDLHIERGNGERNALIYDSPVTSTIQKFSYRELRDLVAGCAGGLVQHGVKKGDCVVIYMPMIPETVIAMLACARIGAIHSVVFGGFAARELAARIRDAKPKMIISASCGIEVSRVIPYKPLLDEAITLSEDGPVHCVIVQRTRTDAPLIEGRDISWDQLMDAPPVPCVSCNATDPLYILYTSGTTGITKGVVRDNGGHLVALTWSMRFIYDMRPGEVFWAASDVGWVVGHSYIVKYAPLAYG